MSRSEPTLSAEPPGVEVRSYRPADQPSWLRCRVLAFLGSDYYDDVLTSKPEMEGGIELVALHDDQVLALLDVSIDGATATIESVAVHPDHCRRGLATALLEQAVAKLAGRGVRRLEAWTRDDEAANAWYRSRGFHESERYLHVYARGQREIETAVSAEPGLVAIKAFLHMVDMGREGEMRERFERVYVCHCYEREV